MMKDTLGKRRGANLPFLGVSDRKVTVISDRHSLLQERSAQFLQAPLQVRSESLHFGPMLLPPLGSPERQPEIFRLGYPPIEVIGPLHHGPP
jgi:hypothetical protein